MTMNKPAIDGLLAHIPSYYELTVASSQRAREIKIGNREHPQPLQTALEEVSEGKVEIYYEEVAAPIQAELALEAAPALPAPVMAPIEAAAPEAVLAEGDAEAEAEEIEPDPAELA